MPTAAANPAPGFRDNPGRVITVEPFDGVVKVTFADAMIASSARALVLKEANYKPVYYLPFEDIYFERLEKSGTSTHCPYKGTASYWNASATGQAENDAMWAYESPYDEMAAIRGHGAFYADKVRVEAVENTPVDPLR